MHAYIHIHIYICMHVHIYIRIHIYPYAFPIYVQLSLNKAHKVQGSGLWFSFDFNPKKSLSAGHREVHDGGPLHLPDPFQEGSPKGLSVENPVPWSSFEIAAK